MRKVITKNPSPTKTIKRSIKINLLTHIQNVSFENSYRTSLLRFHSSPACEPCRRDRAGFDSLQAPLANHQSVASQDR